MKFDSMDIIKAMQIIADSSNQKLRLDKTITAQIISVENIETGEYRVKYQGNSFLAYSYDVKVSFKIGENVYVKIPENDMSKRKIIEGRISSTGNTLTDIMEQQVEINKIEPSFDKIYGYDPEEQYGIIAGVPTNHEYFQRAIYESKGSTMGDHLFRSYLSNYSKIRISGSFLTTFVGRHVKGNYGLIVSFKTLQFDEEGNEEQGTVSYRLDFSNFTGDPYRYTSPSPQSVIIDLQGQSVLGLDSILLFQENFETDKSVNYDGQILTENTSDCNIFVKDVDISFCEVIDLKDTTYYITISTPKGIVFSGATTSLTLDAKLKYKGENILSEKTCKCYWYKEDLTIQKGSSDYDKYGGVRWKKINKQDEDYLPSIEIQSKDVQIHAKFKLVVVYNDVVLSKEIEIKQLDSDYNLSIKQVTKNNSRIILQVVSNIENDNRQYVGDWYFLLPDGGYGLIPDAEKQFSVDVTNYLIYPTVTFYCQTYHDNEPISIETHIFSISDSQDDLTINYIGQDIFQYDANGDIAYEDTELDRTLSISVEWKEGFGSAYTISYLAPDGVEILTDPTKAHTAENSMMENLWVDNTSVLHYNIGQKYSINKNNNVITVKIKCAMNNNEYLFRKEILFLKDGDQGTNGTTYICAIRPVNLKNGLKLSGFHALQYNNGWLGDGLDLRCYVYKNGDLINGAQNFDLTYKWECGSKDVNKQDKLSINPVPGFANLSDYVRIQGQPSNILDTKGDYVLKVSITVREKSNSEDTQIHCQYPVDIAVGGLNMDLIDMNLPSYIKYTASGINAQFLNQELQCLYGDVKLPISSTDESILGLNNNKLDPAQKFQYTGGIAALRCEVSKTMYLLHPIMMYLDTYGNEAINGWDGTKLELDDKGKYILAPQIGAGKKNADNTFTGIVMGKDTQEDKIGLYGYKAGIAQFGFKEDGTAFIGPSGSGQILFNGVKGTITSGNYSNTTGMKIDLDDGHIDSYNFKISSGNMILDSARQRFDFTVGTDKDSRFMIADANNNRLFYISKDYYYLQSRDYIANQQGTKIDLANGRIDSYNFRLSTSTIDLDSETARFLFKIDQSKTFSYFRIVSTDNEGQKILFNASTSSYYLQSLDYNIANKTGMKIDLANGRVDAYSFYLKSSSLTIDSSNNRFVFDTGADNHNGAFIINGRDNYGNIKTLMSVGSGTYYLQSANYNGLSGSALEGVYINLRTGHFRVGGSSVEFKGQVIAGSGKIGPWNITDYGISSDNGQIYLNVNGNASFGTSCYISNGGLYATQGSLGGWNIYNGYMSGGNTTLSATQGITTNSVNISGPVFNQYNNQIGYAYGTIGGVVGSDGGGETACIGMTSYSNSIVLQGPNIRLTPSGGHTYVDNATLRNTVSMNGSMTCGYGSSISFVQGSSIDFSNATIRGLDTRGKFA